MPNDHKGIKVEARKTVEITMKLDEAHARWLRAAMQNPIMGQSPDEETPHDNNMRCDFFDAMDEGLQLVAPKRSQFS